MTTPNYVELFANDEAICPVDAVAFDTLPTAEEVAAGQADLAALTGRYLPTGSSTGLGQGATTITGGGGEPVVQKDYVSRSANYLVGHIGEQGAGFAYGQAGFDLVSGPSGQGGKSSSEPGPDMLPWQRTLQLLVINDNKNQMRKEVRTCTALNENLLAGLDRRIADLEQLADFPDKSLIQEKLQQTRDAFAQGGKGKAGGVLPPGVILEISNAGGAAERVHKKLQQDFTNRYAGVRNADGSQVELGFRNFQPAPTVEEAQAAVEALDAAGSEEMPWTARATPVEPTSGPMLDVIPSPSAGPAGMAGAALAMDWTKGILDFALPMLGVKDRHRRAAEDLINSEVLPHLRNNPNDGALILKTVVTMLRAEGHTEDLDVGPPIVFFGTTPDQAYEQRLRTSMLMRQQAPDETVHDMYYWYDGEKLTRYFPGHAH